MDFKGDVSDFFLSGYTADDLRALIAATPIYDPPMSEEDAKPNLTIQRKLYMLPESIGEGAWNNELTKYAGSLRGCKLGADEILARLITANQEHCTPPLPERELRSIARSIARKPPGNGRLKGEGESAPPILDELRRFAARYPWPKRVGISQRAVLNALLDLAQAVGRLDVGCDERRLTELAGLGSRTTTRAALQALGEQGWLVRLQRTYEPETGALRAETYRMQRPQGDARVTHESRHGRRQEIRSLASFHHESAEEEGAHHESAHHATVSNAFRHIPDMESVTPCHDMHDENSAITYIDVKDECSGLRHSNIGTVKTHPLPPPEVWRRDALGPSARLVWLTLLQRPYTSQRQLARDAEVSEPAVRRCLPQLEAFDMVRRENGAWRAFPAPADLIERLGVQDAAEKRQAKRKEERLAYRLWRKRKIGLAQPPPAPQHAPENEKVRALRLVPQETAQPESNHLPSYIDSEDKRRALAALQRLSTGETPPTREYDEAA